MSTVNEKLTAIADTIRELTHIPDKLSLDSMVGAIHSVYGCGENAGREMGIEQGKQAEYDRFWDTYQENGKRKDWRYAFGGDGWNAETFNPKHLIVVGSIYQAANNMFAMFNRSKTQSGNQILSEPADMTKACKMVDFSNATGLQTTFANARAINITIDANSCTDMNSCFSCSNGGYINYITIRNLTEKCTNFSNTFYNNTVLTEIRFENSVIASAFDIHWSPLSHVSIMSIINALKDLKDTGETLTLTLGTANLAKLADAEKAIATEKGWTLV